MNVRGRMMIFGDNPSGETSTSTRVGNLPMARMRSDASCCKTRQSESAAAVASRADLRFGFGNDGKTYPLDKRDGSFACWCRLPGSGA